MALPVLPMTGCAGAFPWGYGTGNDPIIKERLYRADQFEQGNHGEDVKELYYYPRWHADAFVYADAL